MGHDTDFEQQGREYDRRRLSEILKALRQDRKLSQEQMAARMGVHRNTVSRLEKRTDTADYQTIKRYCEALGEPIWKVMKFIHAPREVHGAK